MYICTHMGKYIYVYILEFSPEVASLMNFIVHTTGIYVCNLYTDV
jgi:hypothetical protein